MLYTTNYHTHSNFCDGQNSLQEMALSAFDSRVNILGFSGHTAFPFASHWHMQVSSYEKYFEQVANLKKEYEGKMEILAGVEADYLPPISYPNRYTYKNFPIDYIIGSVHFVLVDNPNHGGCFAIDSSAKEIYDDVQKFLLGDYKKAIQSYFSLQREMIKNCDCDIIGHIDLIRKRNAELNFFSETDSWYRDELKETAKVVGKSGKVIEINTGGMTRAGMATPYPSQDFLSLLNEQNVPVTINSDTHSISTITEHFETALNFAKESGYKETHYLSQGTWYSQKIGD